MENTCKNIIKQKNSQRLKKNSFYIQKSKQNLNDFKFSQWGIQKMSKRIDPEDQDGLPSIPQEGTKGPKIY
jgi:hypothetical protein